MKVFSIKRSVIVLRLISFLFLLNSLFYVIGLIKGTLGLANIYLNLAYIAGILITAYSPVYSLIIDEKERTLTFKYRFLYLIGKQRTLSFEELDYRYNSGHPFISLGGYEVNFYFKKHSIATLTTVFG